MAEDSDLERSEAASQRRIEQAREKGQIARSRELSTFAVLMAAGGALMAMSHQLMDSMMALMRNGLSIERAVAFDPSLMLLRLQGHTWDILVAFFPYIVVVVVAAIAAPLALGGWLFTFEALEPNFGKLDPIKGIGRMFSVNSVIELVKALLKTLLIGGVAVWVVIHEKDAFFALITEPLGQSIAHLGHMLGFTFMTVAGSLIILVAIDVPAQIWEHARKLKMTKDEVRQEYKETEGSPELKGRIRQLQREAARKRMMAEVPKADVIVTNPTRFAVALSYQGDKMRAPKVVAKGTLLLAQRIRDVGAEHHVPILQAPSLARALFHHAELDEEIPATLYTAVAEVLAYVYQLRRYESGAGDKPETPRELPVPPELDPESQAENATIH
ncbi:MAG: flagellar type III secretion system protein FlhB [Sulfuricella sp.]|nr:flagellar type III secretion system protein FlhB [Sulfuricella sp.]